MERLSYALSSSFCVARAKKKVEVRAKVRESRNGAFSNCFQLGVTLKDSDWKVVKAWTRLSAGSLHLFFRKCVPCSAHMYRLLWPDIYAELTKAYRNLPAPKAASVADRVAPLAMQFYEAFISS